MRSDLFKNRRQFGRPKLQQQNAPQSANDYILDSVISSRIDSFTDIKSKHARRKDAELGIGTRVVALTDVHAVVHGQVLTRLSLGMNFHGRERRGTADLPRCTAPVTCFESRTHLGQLIISLMTRQSAAPWRSVSRLRSKKRDANAMTTSVI